MKTARKKIRCPKCGSVKTTAGMILGGSYYKEDTHRTCLECYHWWKRRRK